MRYLSAVCFLAIVAFADASPAAAQQNCACFCRVQGEGGGGCWVDVPGCNPRSGVRACNDGAMWATIVAPLASPLDGAHRARMGDKREGTKQPTTSATSQQNTKGARNCHYAEESHQAKESQTGDRNRE